MPPAANQPHLLAVNLETRTGTATFGKDGRLCGFSSHARASGEQQRRRVERALEEAPTLEWLVSHGETKHVAVWERLAMRGAVRVQRVDAKSWRDALDVNGSAATPRACERLARRIIDVAGMPQPVVLAADAAEAICVGMWAVTRLGWTTGLPAQVTKVGRVAGSKPRPMARVANG